MPSLQLADGGFVFESSAIVTHIMDASERARARRRHAGRRDVRVVADLDDAEIYSTMNAAEFLEDDGNTVGDAASRASLAEAVRAERMGS